MAAAPNILNLAHSASFDTHTRASAPAVDLVEDLQRVQKAAQKINSILDLDLLIKSVVTEVTHSFGCLEASVYLHDQARAEMVLAGVDGCNARGKSGIA